MELLTDPQVWLAFATLTALEIVLGIDNIIFISILVGRLPEHQRARGRTIGLALAMMTRILLLLSITWVMGLSAELFSVFGRGVSGRDLILVGGGLFLLAKSTIEIHHSLEGDEKEPQLALKATFLNVITQIAIIDIVFSLDSVIAAVGMAGDYIPVMVLAILIAVGVMLLAAQPLGRFIDANPTVKMLALAFIVLIGAYLVAEGFELHIPRGYIYGAMGFSALVEVLNLWAKRNDMRQHGVEPPPVDEPRRPMPR